MKKSSVLKALEHSSHRLNELPHRYADTDFKLIESALAEQYVKERTPMVDVATWMRSRVEKLRKKNDSI